MTMIPEYIATEDIAKAKSSVALSSTHHEVNDDDEGGTCLGKYSKGTLFIFEGVADVLFGQAVPNHGKVLAI